MKNCISNHFFIKKPNFLYRFSSIYQTKDLTPFKFKESSILILIQALISYLIARTLNKTRDFYNQNPISQAFGLKLGIYNTLSMIGSISALNYVSYPVQALMKSSKILSVLLVTFFIGGKRHSKYEYSCAILIALGILIFNLLVREFR